MLPAVAWKSKGRGGDEGALSGFQHKAGHKVANGKLNTPLLAFEGRYWSGQIAHDPRQRGQILLERTDTPHLNGPDVTALWRTDAPAHMVDPVRLLEVVQGCANR